MAAEVARQQCQRIGCDAKFTDDENQEDSCHFHPGIVTPFHEAFSEIPFRTRFYISLLLGLIFLGCLCPFGHFTLPGLYLLWPLLNLWLEFIPFSIVSAIRQALLIFAHSLRSGSGAFLWPSFLILHVVSVLRYYTYNVVMHRCAFCGICGLLSTWRQPPVFHDGGKEWSCCKQKSHDFSMFLELPGCQTGKHTSEKPKPAVAPAVPKKVPTPLAASPASAATCLRCKQGFFCSDHGSKLPTKVTTPVPTAPQKNQPAATIIPKVVDLNAKQQCQNKGCGKSFTEKDNTATACLYHPGPVVFHDRQKGWKCCDVHVTDFEEFLGIAPCTTGWHNANPDGIQPRTE